MLSQQAQQAIQEMNESRSENLQYALTQPLIKQRQDWEDAASQYVQPQNMHYKQVQISRLSAEIIHKEVLNFDSKIIVPFHGGGLTQGSPTTHRKLGTLISAETDMPVLIHNYPLAPEAPFPAALNASVELYQWLSQKQYAPQDIIFGGDSSGAGLACAVILQLQRWNIPLPGAVYLLSPQLDHQLMGESVHKNKDRDCRVFEEDLRICSAHYCGKESPTNPLISLLLGNLKGFPKTFIQTGSTEILLSDTVHFSQILKNSGVIVETDIWEHMWHVFQTDADHIPEAARALHRLRDFLIQTAASKALY